MTSWSVGGSVADLVLAVAIGEEGDGEGGADHAAAGGQHEVGNRVVVGEVESAAGRR